MASETAVHLGEIGDIAVTVGNLDEAKSFYGDGLGIGTSSMRVPWPFFSAARCVCWWARGTWCGKACAGKDGTILYFKVTDIQAVHDALRKKVWCSCRNRI